MALLATILVNLLTCLTYAISIPELIGPKEILGWTYIFMLVNWLPPFIVTCLLLIGWWILKKWPDKDSSIQLALGTRTIMLIATTSYCIWTIAGYYIHNPLRMGLLSAAFTFVTVFGAAKVIRSPFATKNVDNTG